MLQVQYTEESRKSYIPIFNILKISYFLHEKIYWSKIKQNNVHKCETQQFSGLTNFDNFSDCTYDFNNDYMIVISNYYFEIWANVWCKKLKYGYLISTDELTYLHLIIELLCLLHGALLFQKSIYRYNCSKYSWISKYLNNQHV